MEIVSRYDNHFGAGVSSDSACDVAVSNQPTPPPFVPGPNLTDVFTNNSLLAPSIKWQYFIGAEGSLAEYPSHKFDSNKGACLSSTADTARRRELFLSAVYPQSKSVVLVVDHGSALSANQLNIAKAISNLPCQIGFFYFLLEFSNIQPVSIYIR